MAAGDHTPIAAYGERVHDFQVADFGATPNVIKCALIKSAANGGIDPAKTDAYPTWGSAGSTDYSTAEVTAGGTYSAGGAACANVTSTLNSNVVELDWDSPARWDKNASNPTNARWAIIYDDTHADKPVISFYDLGGDKDMTTGNLTVTCTSPCITHTY